MAHQTSHPTSPQLTAGEIMASPKKKAPAEPTPPEDTGLDLGAPDDGDVEALDYVPPTPSAKDIKTAEKVFEAIKSADILGADATISALLQLIDIHPSFTPPEEWPGADSEEYHESVQLRLMSEILVKGCKRLTVNTDSIVFLWRNKEKWVQGGKTVRGNVKAFPTRVRYLLEGKLAAVEINFHHWKTLNPLQRAFSLYHELRQLGHDGSVQKPDFSGFYDEMEVFGPRVFREMMELQRVVQIGSRVDYQHQLPLFDDE